MMTENRYIKTTTIQKKLIGKIYSGNRCFEFFLLLFIQPLLKHDGLIPFMKYDQTLIMKRCLEKISILTKIRSL